MANPPDFSSSGPHQRNDLTSKINWDHNQNWSDEIYYSTPELKSIVQEVVDLAVWNPGNPMSVIIRNDGGSNYRIVSSFEESPDLAARFIVKYKNDAGGNVLSTPIALASIKDAASWKKLFWSELGTLGDFRVSVQTSSDGMSWDASSLSSLDYQPSGHDISSLGTAPFIRLLGNFTGSSGNTPLLVDWTVSCNDDSGESDLSLSLAGNNLSGCDGAVNEWRLLVSNNGPNQATDINIKVDLPMGMSFISGEPGTGFFDPSGQQWIITALDVAESVYLDFSTLTVSSAPALLVRANIKNLNQLDPEPSNNETEFSLTLSSNNAPKISTIPDVVTAFNTTSSDQTFTISDAETPAGNLILTSFSDNTDLIPNENIQLGGSGGTRTISFTPGANQFGSCEITILVSDGECFSTQIFTATVLRHTVANWVAADIVIGQTNFSNQSTAFTNNTTPGAVSSSVSAKGVLAVGGQRNGSTYVGRVMLWNTVPETNGVVANIVVGKNGFNDNTPGCSQNRMRMAEDVAFSPDGEKLIVADGGDGGNNRVLIWNSNSITSGADANVVIGQTNFTNYSSGTGSNKFNRPVGLLVTPDGRLLVTDFYNHRVLIFNQIPTTNNVSADVVIGQPDMFTNTPGITADKFHGPWTTALTADGKLLVSDCYNSRVLIFNKIPEENGVAADLVIGQEDVNISGYNLNGLDEFSVGEPAVSLSPTGMVAVGDFLNHRVTLYNEVPGNNGVQANVVLGQPDFNQGVVFNNGSGTTGSPSAYNMRNVYTIRYDLNDRLFVSGRDMHRVMVFGLPPTQVAELAIDLISLNQEVGGVCYDAETGFLVEVTNNGPETATNVVVKTAFPFGFPFTEYIADKGTYQFQGGEWFIPTIANGETVTLSFFGFVPSTTANKDYTVYAAIRSSNQRDTDFSNNAKSFTFMLKIGQRPRLVISLTFRLPVIMIRTCLLFRLNTRMLITW